MDLSSAEDAGTDGWEWFGYDNAQRSSADGDALALSFARCFKGSDGAAVIGHLRQIILDRRMGPRASDAELRFLEGQRTVVAHILTMIDRGIR